jgi:hypothetical protein
VMAVSEFRCYRNGDRWCTHPGACSDYYPDPALEEAVAQRCAPLVEFAEYVAHNYPALGQRARDALAAYRAQENAGGAEADQ